MLKYSIFFLCILGIISPGFAQNDLSDFFSDTDKFLKQHVKDGFINYPAIVKNPSELNSLVERVAKTTLENVSSQEQKAFLINAYNILVINGIVSNYPSNSPQAIAGFFDSKTYTVAGERLTLNQLEKDKLLKVTQDARLHFALVCAAKGCPRIADFAFVPAQLNEQLEARTRLALNDPYFIRVDDENKKVDISEIFTWYRSDFLKDGKSVKEFINTYREEKIPNDYKVGNYTYDWALNSISNAAQGLSINTTGDKSNIQVFTPSALFRQGQFEINFFNNLYSQTGVRDVEGDRIDLANRETFINTMIQFTYGVSKSARVNVGLDLLLNSASVSPSSEGIFSHFSSNVDFRQTVVSYIAPRVKFVPLKRFPRTSIQTSLQIPISRNLENRDGRFVTHDRYTWLTQFFTDFNIGPDFQVFIEEAIFYRINRNSALDRNFVRFFLSGFLSYFPRNTKATIFGFAQYAPRYEVQDNGFDSQFGLSQWFTQIGFGAKYQLTKNINIEASYGNFVASRRDGAGDVINFGIRFIK